jgi:hypothetical protein
MNKKLERKVKKFKSSQDYIDICYMIDHVREWKPRLDCLQKLGYRLGINILNNKEYNVKTLTIGKRNEIRMQVTPKDKKNLAACVIIED